MKLLKLFNPENLSESEINNLPKRKTTRAIIQNEKGEIAMLYSNKFNYHEIPGGAVDEGETLEHGMVRECLEETGCNVEIIAELGLTQGLRPYNSYYQLNNSYGYFVKKIGDIQENNFDDDEIEENFELVWVTLEKAIELFDELPITDNHFRNYIKERGLLFLNEVKNHKSSN
jgi:ADP-ribose pyrophosphatase YjhB (NUDIX family)